VSDIVHLPSKSKTNTSLGPALVFIFLFLLFCEGSCVLLLSRAAGFDKTAGVALLEGEEALMGARGDPRERSLCVCSKCAPPPARSCICVCRIERVRSLCVDLCALCFPAAAECYAQLPNMCIAHHTLHHAALCSKTGAFMCMLCAVCVTIRHDESDVKGKWVWLPRLKWDPTLRSTAFIN